jgi:hypothetical protein
MPTVMRGPPERQISRACPQYSLQRGFARFISAVGALGPIAAPPVVGRVGKPTRPGQLPHGGWKASLFGDLHVHGPEGVHFYTRGKVVTRRWADPAHRGVNLGFSTSG